MDILRLFRGKPDKAIEKSYPLTSPYMRELIGLSQTDEKITLPYSQHSVVYAAIRIKASNIAQVPYILYTPDGKVIDSPAHPAVTLFREVNPTLDGYELWEAIVTLLDIYGEAFVIKDPEEWKGLPVYLWPVRGDTMKELVQGSRLIAWEYSAAGKRQILSPDQVIHIRYYNPYNPFRGLSPFAVAKAIVDGDWEAVKYNRRFFENDGSPGAVFTTDQSLTEAQYERLKAQLIDNRRGAMHAFRAMLLDGGIKYSQSSVWLKDMPFLDLRKFSKEEIAMVFGVPKQELQSYDDMNYAISRTVDLNFWKKTLMPLMSRIEMKINQYLLSSIGVMGKFDIKSIDVLNEELLNRVDAAAKLHSMGVPFSAINERLSLGFPDDLELEEPYLLPVEAAEGKAIGSIAKTVKRTQDTEAILKAERTKLWRERVEPLYPLFGKTSSAIKDYYHDIERELLRHALQDLEKGLADKWIKKAVEDDDFSWVDAAFSDEKLEKIMREPIERALKMGIRNGDLPEEIETSILAKRMRKIKSVNGTSREAVKGKLKEVLLESMGEGVTEEKRTEMVRDAIKGSMRSNRDRARTIARTEVHGAYNEASWEQGKLAGAKKVRWLSSRDDRVRDSHAALDGKTVQFGETFDNGLRYPMDSEGPAEEVINCRCAFVEIYDE